MDNFPVKQYRSPIQQYSIAFPQGKHEDNVHINPRELAHLELKEETGLVAQKIERLGFFHEAPGYSNQGFHIFLATDVAQEESNLEILANLGTTANLLSCQENQTRQHNYSGVVPFCILVAKKVLNSN